MFGRKPKPPVVENGRLQDKWVMLEAHSITGKSLIRARELVPNQEFRSRNRFLMIIRWEYEASDEGIGMPDAETYEMIQAFEDAVFARADDETWAIEAASITGGGTKEWRFFAPSQERFLDELNQALGGHQPYPIQIEAFEDDQWVGLSELLPTK
jgi:hypothetical protein